MKVEEMISKYQIRLHGTDQIAIPSGNKLTAKIQAEIKAAKPEILTELFRRKAEAEAEEAKRKAEEAAELEVIKNSTKPIKLYYHDGEYLSGHQVHGQAAQLLEKLGLAKWVNGWGYHVDFKAVEALGEEFTYAQVEKYARPTLEAKEMAAAKARDAAAEKKREIMKIINTTKPHQGPADTCSYCGRTGARWQRKTAAGIKYACEPAPGTIHAAAPSAEETGSCLAHLMREHEAWAKDKGLVRCWECGMYCHPSELDETGYCGC